MQSIFYVSLLPTLLAAKRSFDCEFVNWISCKRVADRLCASLPNCSTGSAWTGWSEWSSCEGKTRQRRRRRCKEADAAGISWVGERMQTRKCSDVRRNSETASTEVLPESAWGSWSDWNEWGLCSCPTNQRKRVRHCVGVECSGCGVEYGECERRCSIQRWWSDWSEWTQGQSNVRFRSWCSHGSDGRSLTAILTNETTVITKETLGGWSDWKIRMDIAFRYRLRPGNATITDTPSVDIQYHRITTSNSIMHVTLSFCLCISLVAMIAGFLIQCVIAKLFTKCRSFRSSRRLSDESLF